MEAAAVPGGREPSRRQASLEVAAVWGWDQAGVFGAWTLPCFCMLEAGGGGAWTCGRRGVQWRPGRSGQRSAEQLPGSQGGGGGGRGALPRRPGPPPLAADLPSPPAARALPAHRVGTWAVSSGEQPWAPGPDSAAGSAGPGGGAVLSHRPVQGWQGRQASCSGGGGGVMVPPPPEDKLGPAPPGLTVGRGAGMGSGPDWGSLLGPPVGLSVTTCRGPGTTPGLGPAAAHGAP